MKRLGLLALLLIAAMGAGAGWLDSQISRPYRGHRPEKVFVDIPHGSSRWKIAGILRHDDVIRNRLAFTLFSDWHFRKPIQAGEYYFDQPVNTREVFWKMARGRIYVRTMSGARGLDDASTSRRRFRSRGSAIGSSFWPPRTKRR